MRCKALAVAALLVLAGAAQAQVTIADLAPTIGRIDPATTTRADCDRALAGADAANAPNLFHGSVVCFAANAPDDGTFLLLAGQSRAMTDLSLFEPADEAAKSTAGQLYMLVFFQFGGAGPYETYRDPGAREALFARLTAWRPQLPEGYSPGWTFRKRPDPDAYLGRLGKARDARRGQLESFARLVSDDCYYRLRLQQDEIASRGAIVAGSADDERMQAISKAMEACPVRP